MGRLWLLCGLSRIKVSQNGGTSAAQVTRGTAVESNKVSV